MKNRQLRSWVFMLYPDNPKHEKVVDYLDLIDNSLYIKHIAKYDENGNELNKEHYHCVLKFKDPYWLSKLLQDLNLDEEDAHLFHSYTDFKIGNKNRFKSLDDYIDYLDHVLDDRKPDKYSIDDFHGSLKSWAAEIINNREKDKSQLFLELCDFIKNYNIDHIFDVRTWNFDDWYRLCCENGYGNLFYKEWYKMRDVLKPYINY